jgi:hypothetical protein
MYYGLMFYMVQITLISTDGIRSYGVWFEEAAQLCVLRYYARDMVPISVNNFTITLGAHVSDFYRIQVGLHACFHIRVKQAGLF